MHVEDVQERRYIFIGSFAVRRLEGYARHELSVQDARCYSDFMKRSLKASELAHWSDGDVVDYWLEALLMRYPHKSRDDTIEFLAQLPIPLRDAYSAWLVWADVGNGGLEQYFFNWGLVNANAAAEGFERMGWAESAKIMQQAIQAYTKAVPEFDGAKQLLNRHLKHEITKAHAWNGFKKIYEYKLFGNFEDYWDSLKDEFFQKWPAFVRAHASLVASDNEIKEDLP